MSSPLHGGTSAARPPASPELSMASRSQRFAPALRGLRDGAVVAGLLFAAYLFVVVAPQAGTFGFDAYAYWSVNPANPYETPVGSLAAFTYSPPIARLFSLAASLPWNVFVVLWFGTLIGTVIWIARPRIRVVWLLAFPPVALELYHGNIHLLIAAAIALGFRYPAAWAFIALTKVTPAVGLVWFAVRREWRSLGVALGVTAVIALVSLIVDGGQWGAWLRLLSDTNDGASVNQFQIAVPLLVRIPISVALVAWGARTDRRWTVPVAATLALPILWVTGFAICAALAHSELASRPPAVPRDPDRTP
jgi:glycosyl transferase family 87